MNRTTASPTADDVREAEQRLRSRFIDTLALCYPTPEGGEGCAADLALDAYRDFIRVCAVAEGIRRVPCSRPTGYGSCSRHPMFPKGASVYWCDPCLALLTAKAERDRIVTAVLEKR